MNSIRWVRTERGSGTLFALSMGLLLLTALTLVTLWSAISTARHKLAAAADLTALSAAQSLQSGTAPCPTAHRIATTHHVQLTHCQITGTSVTIQVQTQLDLPAVPHAILTTTARAGPG
ncbi:secretion/DNA translocation related TadE-like protein [Kribbella antiqua]|uniref:Secretion/DNA translocation related TadE-like protein n=1 Tax=Kribbella antiqua TaxID=2512217 RepID=A0A4R2ITH6_9ACTN|nr:Rv3654c family TadE-like protein [Kribbella antiqua]TCO47599.1 secretion/DNA translocation related TadE-like protein [Kribbella antiqua]